MRWHGRDAALAALAAAVYLALAGPFLTAPLRWDETEFARQAKAIAEHGAPRIAFADTGYVTPEDARIRRFDADYGLWHPPFYLYLLAVPVAIAGDGDTALRSLGLLFGAVGVILSASMTRRLGSRAGLTPDRASAAGALAALGVATSPFWIEGTMRLDIDGGLLSLLVVAAGAAYGLLRERGPRTRAGVVAAAAFVLLWAKPPGAALLVLALALYALAFSRREAAAVVGSAVAAGAAFVVTWLLYCAAFDLPWDFPLVYTARKEDTAVTVFDIANTIRFNVAWVGFPLLALGGIALVAAARRLVRRAPLPHDALAATAGVVALFYTLVWAEPGKYTVVLVPLLAVTGAIEVVRLLAPVVSTARHAVVAVAVAAALAGVYALLVGDVVTAPARRVSEGGFSAVADDPRLPRLVAGLVVLLVAVLAARLTARRWPAALALAAVVSLIPAQAALAVDLARDAETTLVLAPKRESGFAATVDWLRLEIEDGDVIVAPKDVAYYLDRGRVIPLDRESTFRLGAVIRAVARAEPRYFVGDDQSFELVDFVVPEWRDRYELRRRVGSFEIYERTSG